MCASPTAETGSTMRRFGNSVVTRHIIDHHGTGANSRRQFPASAGVPRPDAAAQAEWRVIRKGDGLVGGRHGTNREHGAECFFAHQLHRVIHVSDHRGPEEIRTEIGAAVAAGENPGATLFGVAKLLFNFFELALANHWSDIGFGIGGRTQAQLFGFFNAQLSELFGNLLLDVNPLNGKAGLAAIRETAPDCCT